MCVTTLYREIVGQHQGKFEQWRLTSATYTRAKPPVPTRVILSSSMIPCGNNLRNCDRKCCFMTDIGVLGLSSTAIGNLRFICCSAVVTAYNMTTSYIQHTYIPGQIHHTRVHTRVTPAWTDARSIPTCTRVLWSFSQHARSQAHTRTEPVVTDKQTCEWWLVVGFWWP